MEAKNPLNNAAVTFGLIAVLVGGAFYLGHLTTKMKYMEGGLLGQNQAQNEPAEEPTIFDYISPIENVVSLKDQDHVKGNKDARFAIIEYSDFECPYCAAAHTNLTELLNSRDDAYWVYRHLPLDFHPSAEPLAKASECIFNQGGEEGFWSAVDAIFTTNQYTSSNLGQLATDLGFDAALLESCVSSDETLERVQTDVADANAMGITGTPGIIVNDTQTGKAMLIPGAFPAEDIIQVMDFMLEN